MQTAVMNLRNQLNYNLTQVNVKLRVFTAVNVKKEHTHTYCFLDKKGKILYHWISVLAMDELKVK